MTDPFLVSRLPRFPEPLNELLNVAHNRPFSLLFANYSWLLGLAGGVVLVWVLTAPNRRDPVHQLTMPLAVVSLVAGFLNVLAEVRQPARLWYGYIYGWNEWDTAVIKYGILLLPLFLVTCWWLTFQCLDRQALERGIAGLPAWLRPLADGITLGSRRYDLFAHPVAYRLVLAAMTVFGLFAPLYSGVFLMYEHGVPVWNSPAQALLFLATAITKGAAVFLLLTPLLHRLATGERLTVASLAPYQPLRWLALGGLTVAAVAWFGWMWWLGRLGTTADQQFTALIAGPYHRLAVWHWEIAGLILPLIVLATPLFHYRVAAWLAAFGILWGSYAIRLIVVFAGQALNRSGAGYLGFTLDPDVVAYTAYSAVFLLGLLAALLLLPYHRLEEER